MKKLIVILLFASCMILLQETANAQDRGFGVGASIGAHDGLSYKAWVSETTAIAGVLSFRIAENNSSFYTHADYLKHKLYEDLDWEVGILHYYYGAGVNVLWRDLVDDTGFGIRLPSGMGFNFTDVPVDLYFEIAPTLNISPDFSFGFEGALGFRYYLN